MEQGQNAGQRDQCTKNERVRYTLEQYRHDRVGANIRRLTKERTVAGADYIGLDAPPASQTPRRRAVLREISMPSAFEYVSYIMPETTPQEVVSRRQIARDMTAPGISSDGANVADIVHQPPPHATLAPPAARSRSSRDILQSRDRAMAADENVAPLPRPYVPRGVIDSYGEPYQHHRRLDGRPVMARQIREEAPALLQASRNLQAGLGIASGNSNPARMGLVEVEEVVRLLNASRTDLNIGRNEIFGALRNLQQNWYPEEGVLQDTAIDVWVMHFTNHANPEVAQLAVDLIQAWRQEIRMIRGRSLATNVATHDPFVDEGTDYYGDFLAGGRWDSVLHQRQLAAQDYSAAASAEIRAAWQRRQMEVQDQRDAQNNENQRLHMQARVAVGAAVSPSREAESARDSDLIVTDPEGGASHRGEHHGGEGDCQGRLSNALANIDEDLMPTGNQDFEILEADPSPERPQRIQELHALQERPEDVPVQSVEVGGPIGPCHECPDFPGTYHHICAPENPHCVDQPGRAGRPITISSSSSSPSQSPRLPQRRIPEDETSLAVLLERAARPEARGMQPAGNGFPKIAGDNINLGRIRPASTRRVTIAPVRHPANAPEDIADPFVSTKAPKGFAIKKRSDGQDLVGSFSLASPTLGRTARPQHNSSPATSGGGPGFGASTSSSAHGARARGPRPRWADYTASTRAELYKELVNRRNEPASRERSTKEDMIRMLMTLDTSGNRSNGASSGLNTGLDRSGSSGNGQMAGPLHLDFSYDTQRPIVRGSLSRNGSSSTSSARGGSKRVSPSSNVEPIAKRLRNRK